MLRCVTALSRAVPRAALAGLACLLLLAGCIPESENPLGPQANAVRDTALAGVWATDISGETLYLHVLMQEGGLMDLVTISHAGDLSGQVDRYQGYVTELGSRRFVNLQPAGDSGEDSGGAAPPYVFVAYELDGQDKLTVRFLSEKPLIAAVDAKQLAGEVTGSGADQSVTLTDGAEKIAAFLAAADPATLFDRTLAFRRIGAPPAP